MPLTDAFRNQIVRAMLGEAIPPESIYLRLSTTTPNPDGTNWTEVDSTGYGGYAAQAIAGAVSAPANGAASSNAVVPFPTPTTGGAAIAAIGLWTGPTGGTIRAYAPLTPAVLIVAGAQVQIPIGALVFQAV